MACRARFVVGIAIAMGSILCVAGCSGPRSGLTAGASCTRSSECATGLVCNMRMCTGDLTGFGMGVVPNADAGPREDAGMDMDAASDLDSGPPMDSGPEPDTGPPVMVDAFVPPMPDAFVPPEDAFVPPEPDAFVPPEPDAFVDEDAGM